MQRIEISHSGSESNQFVGHIVISFVLFSLVQVCWRSAAGAADAVGALWAAYGGLSGARR